MSAKVHDPITSGETLLTEFLEPLGISQHRFAQDLHEEELRQVEVLVSPEAA